MFLDCSPSSLGCIGGYVPMTFAYAASRSATLCSSDAYRYQGVQTPCRPTCDNVTAGIAIISGMLSASSGVVNVRGKAYMRPVNEGTLKSLLYLYGPVR